MPSALTFSNSSRRSSSARFDGPRAQLVDIDRLHHRPLGHQHGLLRRAADAEREQPGRTPVRAHGRHLREHPVDDIVVRQQHGELRLVLRAAALGGDDHLDFIAGHELDVRDGRRVVAGTPALAIRVGEHRGPQLVVRIEIGTAHALVHHLGQRKLRIPAHVHAHPHEGHADARVLADRPVALRRHARVDEDLCHCVLCGRRLLALPGFVQRPDVIHRVIAGDELEGVGDALDEIVLADGGHGPVPGLHKTAVQYIGSGPAGCDGGDDSVFSRPCKP